MFSILSKYVIICLRTQCKVVPVDGHVTYIEFFYAHICAIGGFADGMSDTKQFELIYEKYADDVFRVALYLIKDKNKAQDIVQQAFVNIYKQLRELDEESIYGQLLIEAKRLAKKQDTKEG